MHQTGLHDVVGCRMRDLAPAHEAHWFEIYGQVALTGVSVRFEHEAAALGAGTTCMRSVSETRGSITWR